MLPLVDLTAQYRAYRAEFDAAVARVVTSARFIGGGEVEAFASEFAESCGGGHTVPCGNGTDALELAILGLIGKGDGTGEIITVAHTFIATAEAITRAGYRPVFVDVSPETLLISPEAVAAAITGRTRAILPVHLYGQMAEMDAIMALADAHGLKVIEDAAQAHGAQWQGRGPGHWGDAACFSFFPGKNLGAWGDAGAIFTRDAALARHLRMGGNHGRASKYVHDFEGMNSRLDALQAAILRVKLRHLGEANQARQRIAGLYDDQLAGLNEVRPIACRSDATHVHHLYVVRVPERDRVLLALNQGGIGAGVHYPVPLHEQPAYRYLGLEPDDLPVTSTAAREILSLPLFPEMTNDQVATTVDGLKAALLS